MKQLADSLEMKVVAKGIENEYPHGELEFFGCEFGQDYLFGVPQPEAMILDGHRSKNPRALTSLAEALRDLPSLGCPR